MKAGIINNVNLRIKSGMYNYSKEFHARQGVNFNFRCIKDNFSFTFFANRVKLTHLLLFFLDCKWFKNYQKSYE